MVVLNKRIKKTVSLFYVYLCVFAMPLHPLTYTKPHQCLEFKLEMVAFLFFKDNLKHFFILLLDFRFLVRKPKAHQV